MGFAMHHTRKICFHHLLFYGMLVFVIKKSFPLQDIFRKPQKMTKVTSDFVCSKTSFKENILNFTKHK